MIASQSYAATIRGARLDSSKRNVLVDVTYGGGCGKHEFSLDVNFCTQTHPVSCEAELVHQTEDACEALISKTVIINLKQYKLNSPYYSKGLLTIKGDLNWQQKKPSEATVLLP